MERYKIMDDEAAEVTYILEQQGFKSLLKVINNLVVDQYYKIISDEIGPSDERNLIHDKLKADGAKKLFFAIQSLKSISLVKDYKRTR